MNRGVPRVGWLSRSRQMPQHNNQHIRCLSCMRQSLAFAYPPLLVSRRRGLSSCRKSSNPDVLGTVDQYISFWNHKSCWDSGGRLGATSSKYKRIECTILEIQQLSYLRWIVLSAVQRAQSCRLVVDFCIVIDTTTTFFHRIFQVVLQACNFKMYSMASRLASHAGWIMHGTVQRLLSTIAGWLSCISASVVFRL